jgi:GTP-binding protein LepA
MNQSNIRNFSIIAHIDHGKSTLTDKLIHTCNGILNKKFNATCILDTMQIEKDRGITVKAQSVSLDYYKDNKKYQLNLIDTPGHADFSYEVSRSLIASDGVILIVDASQGVQAQTVSHYYKAINMGLIVIPVINKIDLFSANCELVQEQLITLFNNTININDIILCSAKKNIGIDLLINEIIDKIPPPKGNKNNLFEATVIDSWFDNYKGIGLLIYVKEGAININDKFILFSSKKEFIVDNMGKFVPAIENYSRLESGEIGYIYASIKIDSLIRVGDILIDNLNLLVKSQKISLPEIKPSIYVGFFSLDTNNNIIFRKALEKLKLNDSSLIYEPEFSNILGYGFRIGFLGLLHMEIIKERLEDEYNLELVTSIPTVGYKIILKNKETFIINNPLEIPSTSLISELQEPILEIEIIAPKKFIGSIISLCINKRGVQINFKYIGDQIYLIYEIPSNEIISNFVDKLKSITEGYASFDYKFKCFKKANLVRLNILVNKKNVDAFTTITIKENAYHEGKNLIEKLSKLIPRQMFEVSLQAQVNNKIISSTSIKALRKNVTGKCYGGDITRKRKLLEKQKKGKDRMKNIGNITIPKDVFVSLVSMKL